MKNLEFDAKVININLDIHEALVKFSTGKTAVVKIDERFNADQLSSMLEGSSVRVQFDLRDQLDQGKIIWVNEGSEVVTS